MRLTSSLKISAVTHQAKKTRKGALRGYRDELNFSTFVDPETRTLLGFSPCRATRKGALRGYRDELNFSTFVDSANAPYLTARSLFENQAL